MPNLLRKKTNVREIVPRLFEKGENVSTFYHAIEADTKITFESIIYIPRRKTDKIVITLFNDLAYTRTPINRHSPEDIDKIYQFILNESALIFHSFHFDNISNVWKTLFYQSQRNF